MFEIIVLASVFILISIVYLVLTCLDEVIRAQYIAVEKENLSRYIFRASAFVFTLMLFNISVNEQTKKVNNAPKLLNSYLFPELYETQHKLFEESDSTLEKATFVTVLDMTGSLDTLRVDKSVIDALKIKLCKYLPGNDCWKKLRNISDKEIILLHTIVAIAKLPNIKIKSQKILAFTGLDGLFLKPLLLGKINLEDSDDFNKLFNLIRQLEETNKIVKDNIENGNSPNSKFDELFKSLTDQVKNIKGHTNLTLISDFIHESDNSNNPTLSLRNWARELDLIISPYKQVNFVQMPGKIPKKGLYIPSRIVIRSLNESFVGNQNIEFNVEENLLNEIASFNRQINLTACIRLLGDTINFNPNESTLARKLGDSQQYYLYRAPDNIEMNFLNKGRPENTYRNILKKGNSQFSKLPLVNGKPENAKGLLKLYTIRPASRTPEFLITLMIISIFIFLTFILAINIYYFRVFRNIRNQPKANEKFRFRLLTHKMVIGFHLVWAIIGFGLVFSCVTYLFPILGSLNTKRELVAYALIIILFLLPVVYYGRDSQGKLPKGLTENQ